MWNSSETLSVEFSQGKLASGVWKTLVDLDGDLVATAPASPDLEAIHLLNYTILYSSDKPIFILKRIKQLNVQQKLLFSSGAR